MKAPDPERPEPAKPGRRPSPEVRRSAILEAAGAVFFEQGFTAASIDAIIERTGGSKRNIYQEFGSKEGLFTALVTEISDRVLAALSAEEGAARDLHAALLGIGRRLMSLYLSPALIGVYRAIVTESQRFPELARYFYEKGPERGETRLAELLEAANAAGQADVPDCRLAASHFVGMLRDNLHLQVVLGLRAAPGPEELEKAVKSVVDLFYYGVRRR